MAKLKMVICPWCGEPQPVQESCRACHRGFDAQMRSELLSAMGPWFIRNEGKPFEPGFSYARLEEMIRAREIDRNTIVRGPTTRQMWTAARRTPGLAHLLGYCFACDERVHHEARSCPSCSAPFGRYTDRNDFGLPEEGAPASAWVPPTPEPAGISSFAPDEELVAPSPPAPQDQSAEARRSEPGPGSADPLILSLRGQVQRLEQRSSRRQIVMLLLVILLPVGVILAYRAGLAVARDEEVPSQSNADGGQ